MKLLLQTGALAVVLSMAVAAPAHAQRLSTNGDGTFGRVSLNTDFQPDPYSVSVTAGGPVDASTLGQDCVGSLPQRASFTLNYRAGDTLPLIISAVSQGDAVIAVRAPNGAWSCNDDTDELNPAVRWDSPRSGRYQIFVGNLDATATIPAVLYVSETGTGAMFAANNGGGGEGAPDFSLDPAYGAVDLTSGYQPDPHVQAIQAGGGYDASQLQAGCVGWIARAPDYRVNFTAGNAGLPLIFSVGSSADTTLVINDAGGNWVCDDDGGNEGLNPSITFAAPASGQYDVWVGTFAQGQFQPSTLHVSELTSQ